LRAVENLPVQENGEKFTVSCGAAVRELEDLGDRAWVKTVAVTNFNVVFSSK
jgi:hypothetical protein